MTTKVKTSKDIIEAKDILMQARDCIYCVSAAASGPVVPDGDTIVTVVNIAGDKIDKALALLDEDCGAGCRRANRTKNRENAERKLKAF